MIDGTAIVLQARMGSTRLPGKTLASIAGRPMLEHCVERLRASGLPVVLATTTRDEDDPVAREGERLGIAVVRGPGDDVLGRFLLVASTMSLVEVVRATADNPAVDLDAPRRVLELLRRAGADHATVDGLPYGTTVEAVSTTALRRAVPLITDPQDLEHVTSFIRRDPRFVAVHADAPAEVRRPDLTLTVDTPADLAFVRAVFERAERTGSRPIPLSALIAATDAHRAAYARGSGA